jgi:hypothetical protein
MSDKIREALAKLDIDNDNHWTTEGVPRLDVMKDLVGDAVSRSDITSAAKGFSRKTPNLEIEKPENTGSGEAADAPAETPEKTEDSQETPDEQAPEETAESDPAPSETTVAEDEEVELSDDEAVEAELTNSRVAFDKAKVRFEAAQKAMDEVILRRDQEANGGRNPAHDIKAYQASQAKQREATAQNRRAMVAAINATKTKF